MFPKGFISKEYGNILTDLKAIALIPSPPFNEQRKIAYLAEYSSKLGYKDMKTDSEGNLIVYLPGKSQKTVVFSAHTDTVFGEQTPLAIVEKEGKIHCPGICDNSMGITSLLYLMKYAKEFNAAPYYSTVFLFNVGEEELGNLRGIRHFFDNFEKSGLVAHICVEGHSIGRLTREFAGNHRVLVSYSGKGGHSWRDYGRPNAIISAAKAIGQISRISLPTNPKATINIGTISGGESINSIAANAEFTYEVRSADKDALSEIIKNVEAIIGSEKELSVSSKVLGDRPCGRMENESLVSMIKGIHKKLGITTTEDLGSTDSNYPASLGLPSFTIGITDAKNTHSVDEFLFTEPIKKGVEQLIEVFSEIALKELLH